MFNDDFYIHDFESSECEHEWKKTGGEYRECICTKCSIILKSGVPANSVKIVYRPPKPFIIDHTGNLFKPHYQSFKPKM